MSQTTTPDQANIPADVAAFAAERGVADYLPAVQVMTERVFPNAPVTVRLEDDPEIVDERHIVFEVDVAGLDVLRYAELHWQWSRELFRVCPPTHVCLFGLHLNIGDQGPDVALGSRGPE
jgi:hypothetical protein